MGCLWSIKMRYTATTSVECLARLQEVESLLEEMLRKYQRQHDDLHRDILTSLREKGDKQLMLHKLRRKKIILHYMESTRKKIASIVSKQYALENLNITRLQLQAIKDTVKVFKVFNKSHSYEKIDNLKDQLEELTDQFMDVENLITEESSLLQFDDSELEEELNQLNDGSLSFPEIPMHEIELTTTKDDQTMAVLDPIVQ
ncbi:MAG: hypothetical protein CMO44_13810 [Verrucomicrobiales bacterium]|nr:hypothetical protein [Verrucomicrobiales bacterium]